MPRLTNINKYHANQRVARIRIAENACAILSQDINAILTRGADLKLLTTLDNKLELVAVVSLPSHIFSYHSCIACRSSLTEHSISILRPIENTAG